MRARLLNDCWEWELSVCSMQEKETTPTKAWFNVHSSGIQSYETFIRNLNKNSNSNLILWSATNDKQIRGAHWWSLNQVLATIYCVHAVCMCTSLFGIYYSNPSWSHYIYYSNPSWSHIHYSKPSWSHYIPAMPHRAGEYTELRTESLK